MNKSLYVYRGSRFSRYPLVELPEGDVLIQGRRGWIFFANSTRTRLGVVVAVGKNREEIKYYDIKDFPKAIKRIDGFTAAHVAVNYANNPNLRHPT